MSQLDARIQEDLVQAMKQKDMDRLTVLRMLKTTLTNTKIQKKRETLEDAEILEVLQKQAKQRKESIESFEKAGRQDLAEKEKREYDILLKYLPEQLGDAEIRALAEKAIAATGASTKADMGRVMKELMPSVKGKADGKRVNEILARLLP